MLNKWVKFCIKILTHFWKLAKKPSATFSVSYSLHRRWAFTVRPRLIHAPWGNTTDQFTWPTMTIYIGASQEVSIHNCIRYCLWARHFYTDFCLHKTKANSLTFCACDKLGIPVKCIFFTVVGGSSSSSSSSSRTCWLTWHKLDKVAFRTRHTNQRAI